MLPYFSLLKKVRRHELQVSYYVFTRLKNVEIPGEKFVISISVIYTLWVHP